MLDGTYDVIANTKKGEVRGVVTLEKKGGQLICEAGAKGIKKKFVGSANGDAFTFNGEIKVLKKRLAFDVSGQVIEDFIVASAKTNIGDVLVEGVRR